MLELAVLVKKYAVLNHGDVPNRPPLAAGNDVRARRAMTKIKIFFVTFLDEKLFVSLQTNKVRLTNSEISDLPGMSHMK